MNKFVASRPYADAEAAARKIVELANAVEIVLDGRTYIEKINGPMLFELKATPAESKAALDRAIDRGGWLTRAGPLVRFTQSGKDFVCIFDAAIRSSPEWIECQRTHSKDAR
jgi:hypothetical protein